MLAQTALLDAAGRARVQNDISVLRDTLIPQANGRAPSIAGVFGAFVTAVAVAIAVAGSRGEPGWWTLVFGIMTGLCVLVGLCAVSICQMPHLRGLPRDASPEACRVRINKASSGSDDDGVPELLRLQRTHWRKERACQVAVGVIIPMCLFGALAFITLI